MGAIGDDVDGSPGPVSCQGSAEIDAELQLNAAGTFVDNTGRLSSAGAFGCVVETDGLWRLCVALRSTDAGVSQ
jgi:hypothetical protein